MGMQRQGLIVRLVWITLIVATGFALFTARWSMAFVAQATLLASMVPGLLARRMDIRLPIPFLTFTVLFIFGTLFLGEALDFYNRLWWWDIALHGSSAVGFGLVGFLFIFYLFEGDRFAAPPIAVAFLGACFAVTIGAVWEIFEYGMDQFFGLNMQKTGLDDTMGDLIVDCIGSAIGGLSGFLYLKGLERGGLFSWVIAEFVDSNRGLFQRRKR